MYSLDLDCAIPNFLLLSQRVWKDLTMALIYGFFASKSPKEIRTNGTSKKGQGATLLLHVTKYNVKVQSMFFV